MKKAQKEKIARKILLPFVIIFCVLIISLIGSLSNFVNKKIRLIIKKEAQAKIDLAKQHFEINNAFLLNEMKNISSLLAPMISDSGHLPRIQEVLKGLEGFTENYSLHVFDPEGRIIMENLHMDNVFQNTKSCFQKIERIVSHDYKKIYLQQYENNLILIAIVPIAYEGRVIGFIQLCGHLGHHFCQRLEKELNTPLYLIVNNKVVASSQISKDLAYPELPPKIIKLIDEEKNEIILERVHFGDKEPSVAFLPFKDPEKKNVIGHLMILIENALIQDLSIGIIRTGTFYGLIGLGILTIMGILIAKGITLPVVNLVRITKKIGEGDLDIRIKPSSNDEIGELACAFNKMTEELKNTTVSKEYVDNIIKNMIDPLIVIDYYGKIKMVNKAFSGLLDYTKAEIIDKPITIILAKRDSKDLIEKREIINYETYFITKSGKMIPVLFSKSIMRDKNGLMIYAICTGKDITERIRIVEAERQREAARAERQRLFSVLDILPAIVCLKSPDYFVPFANRKFKEIFGDTIGRHCYEIFYDFKEPCKECKIFEIITTKKIEKWELTRPDDSIYEMYDTLFTDVDNSQLVLELGIDITERRQMEKARKEAERQLEEQRARAVVSDRLSALGEMATGMAHELNQPLSGVRGLAEHILIGFDRDWDLSKGTIRENVQMIIEQTERMTHVIEHTRMFARGVGSPNLLPVQINEVIRSAQDLIESQLRYRGLRLKCDLAEGLPVILANPFSLEEVILNLINNARDALMGQKKRRYSKNSKEIMIRTLQGWKDSECAVKIEVIDHGAGIPQDLMSKVFNPFFTTKAPDKGTGLGLAISKSIIEEFKGTIAIDSTPDKGTTVTIILPAMEQE